MLRRLGEPLLLLCCINIYDEGFFLAQFENAHDCLAVLDSGPYTIKNQPVVLKQWTADLKFSPEQMTVLPIWVKLPLQFWGQKSLSRIANVAGKPLHTDECTEKQTEILVLRGCLLR